MTQQSLMNFDKYESYWKKNVINDEVNYSMKLINKTDEELKKYKFEKGWIRKSLESSGLNLQHFNDIILIGSGPFPYSLIDCYKKFPNIKYHGIERDYGARAISLILIEKLNLLDNITIYINDGQDFNYSVFGPDSLIYLSYDLKNKDKVLKQVYKYRKTNVFICYPEKIYNNNYLYIKNA